MFVSRVGTRRRGNCSGVTLSGDRFREKSPNSARKFADRAKCCRKSIRVVEFAFHINREVRVGDD